MILLYLALSWLLGIAFVRWLLPSDYRPSLHNLLVASLGAGVGMGICSSLYFLTLAAFGPKLAIFAGVEGAALVIALAVGIFAKNRGVKFEWSPGSPAPWYLTAIFAIVGVTAICIFFFYAMAKPHGEWDAWSIWNLRARFLVRGGENWRDAFSGVISWSHPGYPLLLPGIVALLWTLAGSESTLGPISVAFLFTFGAASVLIATLGALRGKTQSLIAGIVLLGGSGVLVNAANQYADIPLSFFILATLAVLCLQERYPEEWRFSLLAGITAGLAAWTKNEGVLFLAAVVLARAGTLVHQHRSAELKRQTPWLAVGLAPWLALLIYFKTQFATSADLLSKNSNQIYSHVTDIGRWITVLQAYFLGVFRIGSFLLPVVLLLILYGYLVRFKVEERDRGALTTVLTAVVLMMLGDFAVYVAFPNDLIWQLNTSLDRLLLQLWPSILLAFFLATKSLEVQPQTRAPKGKGAKRSPHPGRRTAETR